PRPPVLAGRAPLLARIAGALDPAPVGVPATVVLAGLAGSGRTSVAVEYAHRAAGRYPVVWQFHGADPTGLRAQYAELARLLDPDDLLDRGDPVARVHAALADLPGWLLILDDLPDPAGAREWLPPKGSGQVLVTTADGGWPGALEVGPLDLPDAVRLLLDAAAATGSDVDSATAIATELGRLPLALAQAAGYVAATGRDLAGYLALLRTDRPGVLARGGTTPVTATWRLALADLSATSPGSVWLLRLLAHLGPDRIPLRLLLDPERPLPTALSEAAGATYDGLLPPLARALSTLHDSPLALDDAVAGLRRYSLVGPPGGTVSVHPLVQAVTRDQLGPDERQVWQQVAAGLVNAAIPAEVSLPASWPACAALLPHAGALGALSGGRWRLAEYLQHSGDHAGARQAWTERVAAYTAAKGADDPTTLAARANLANTIGDTGDAVAARDAYAALLPSWQRRYGPDAPQTLTLLGHLARWTGHAGDPGAALRLYHQVAAARERILGPQHPDTLTARDNCARLTGETGDPLAARDQYAHLVRLRQAVSGPDHPYTLVALGNLAFWTGKAGDAAGARDRYAELLPRQRAVLGPEHPSTLTTWDNLANWSGAAGDPVTARDQYAALLPIRERISGADHPHTRNVRDNLAFWAARAAR
ncbi:MAG TPA: FxSxx-COOH system tetratricopeptide repeat protein, partial [Rugosimonospora sp.]|nr:FxSxx-COOH system tetratricopeptide repeat protein [Rugosimonospora sp.]